MTYSYFFRNHYTFIFLSSNLIRVILFWLWKFEVIKRLEICNSNIFKEFHSCTPPFNSRQIDQVQMGCKFLKFRYSKMATKGGFFSESAIRFFRSPNLKKKIFQKTILSLKFKFPANNSNGLWIYFLHHCQLTTRLWCR